MKNRSVMCVLICFCLLLCLLPTYSNINAKNEVILVAINNTVIRPLSNSIMPLQIGESIYMPYEILSHLSTINYYYNPDIEQIFIFDSQRQITFDLSNHRAYDESGALYIEIAKHIDGRTYIPFDMVCKKFNIYCTLTNYTDIAPLLRINEGPLIASDEDFSRQLQFLLKTTYNDYISSGQIDIPIIPNEPGTSLPTKKLGFLLFNGINLPAVRAMSADAVFFLSAEDISNNGDVIRHAIAKGHEIGLYLDETSDISLAQQFRTLNEALRLQACAPAHLVTIKGGSENINTAEINELINCGARIWDAHAFFDPTSTTAIDDLLKQVKDSDSTIVISIPASEAALVLLPEVYSQFVKINLSLLGVEVWTTPINNINDVR